jgi:hypothetical protein
MALLTLALVTTVLFSMTFLAIFFAARRQEEEYWHRRARQFATVPVLTDRRNQQAI